MCPTAEVMRNWPQARFPCPRMRIGFRQEAPANPARGDLNTRPGARDDVGRTSNLLKVVSHTPIEDAEKSP